MIETAFIGPNRKVIKFRIKEKKVVYFDEMWKEGIQIYPYPKELVKKLLKSKKPHISAYGLLIHEANSGRNLSQYKACKDDKDVAKVIRRDCVLKGLVEIK